tara:strand:+ start:340 stop:663 length:324 start_codon:yes stop_codon:yes gene_type:complete
MRANITYSVDVENIPEEIKRIIRSEEEALMHKLQDVVMCIHSKAYTDAREKIFEARKCLGNTDIRLYELDSILSGYIEVVNEASPDSSGEETEPEAELEESSENEGG